MKHTWIAAAGLLLALLLLSGCALPGGADEAWQDAELPAPAEANMVSPNTDSVPLRRLDGELFMRSADGAMLMPVEISMSVHYTQDAALLMMQELIAASAEGLRNPIPQGTKVLSVEHTNNVVTVDLSIDAYNVAEARDLLWMDAAIANTLGSLEDVKHVNVLIGGRKYSLDGLSMGALAAGSANASLLWSQSRTELDYIAMGDMTYEAERTAVVYYPSLSGGTLLPVAMPVRYAGDDAAQALLSALSTLPADAEGVRAAFSQAPECRLETMVTEDGRRVIKVDFSAETWAAMAQDEPGMSCAAAALTLVSFMPEIDGVVFCADGMLITEYSLAGERFAPELGVITRESLRSRIGMAVDIYFADEQGGLRRVTRVVSPMVEHYPRMLLSMLMEEPAEAGAKIAVPEGVTVEDVLGISLQGDVMQVNLSANFYRLCQTLDAVGERQAVYAIVNTLCNLSGVDAVQFFIEGEQADVLSEQIYIRVPLMPNPGMAEEETPLPVVQPVEKGE